MRALADLFPGSAHVIDVGLDAADDRTVWSYAATSGFVIVSKDADFADLAVLRGSPPKIVWVRRGNCTRKVAEALLRASHDEIAALVTDSGTDILEIW